MIAYKSYGFKENMKDYKLNANLDNDILVRLLFFFLIRKCAFKD